MFGSPLAGQQSAFGATPQVQTNPMKDIEVSAPPEDTVSAMEFSPIALQQNFLLAGSWDSSVRLWEVESSGKTVPRQMQNMGGAVLDVCWTDVSFGDGFRHSLQSFQYGTVLIYFSPLGWYQSIHCIVR